MRSVLYAGSFDPITNGHIEIIRTAWKLFGKVIVGVARSETKTGMFSVEERLALVRDAVGRGGEVEVVEIPAGVYTAEFAHERDVHALVRGIRDGYDLNDEMKLADANFSIRRMPTVFIPSPRETAHISSSYTKRFIGPKGWRTQVKSLVPPNVFEALVEKALQKRWPLQSFERGRYLFRHDIVQRYKGRPYHNLHHLLDCFEALDEYQRDAAVPDKLDAREMNRVEWAIWYHDAIYDTHSTENEEKSADLAFRVLADMNRPSTSDTDHSLPADVRDLIVYSKHDGLTYPCRRQNERARDVFLDIDLSILGAPPERYVAYADGITNEYAWVERSLFARTRIGILERMMKKATIYNTAAFEQRYGQRARWNMRDEADRLKEWL